MFVLALASMIWWRPTSPVPDPGQRVVPRASAWWSAALILAVGVALGAPRLASSFWWDELVSLMLVVRRGPLVILSFSSSANNHVLNSALMWVTTHTLGEHEWAVRLWPFIMSLAAVQLVFWTLVRTSGVAMATTAGLLAAMHGWIAGHGTEARGYAGAILCTWVAMATMAQLLTRPTLRATLLYIVASVAAFGFVTTSLLVPLAHGALGVVLALRARTAEARATALNIVFACLWVAVLGLVAFGLPLPQILDYSRTVAHIDHPGLTWAALGEMALYLAGLTRTSVALAAGVAYVIVAGIGYAAALRGTSPTLRRLAVAMMAPALVTILYFVTPGTRSSPRFFAFLLLPACVGVAFGLRWLWQRQGGVRAVAVALSALWLFAIGDFQRRALTIGRPDLRALRDRVGNQRVALIGAQATVNRFYFPDAVAVGMEAPDSVPYAVANADIVIEGRATKDRRLSVPDSTLAALGFGIVGALRSAVPDQAEFVVYARAPKPGDPLYGDVELRR